MTMDFSSSMKEEMEEFFARVHLSIYPDRRASDVSSVQIEGPGEFWHLDFVKEVD